jgi:hypothetical protein
MSRLWGALQIDEALQSAIAELEKDNPLMIDVDQLKNCNPACGR